jgi:osmoprotectant transport system substrate-binding protein
MTSRPLRWSLALLAPLALLVAACGDDDNPTASGGDSTTTSAAGDTTTTGGAGESTTTTEGGAPSGDVTCSSVTAPDDAPAIVVAAQDFGESKILAAIYAACLEAAGFDASVQEVGGFRDLELAAFDSGDVNLAPEYAASMLEQLNGDETEATGDAAETTELLQGYLDDLDLVALDPSDAVDTNSFVVTQDTADELGLSSISDLADHTDLTLGAPSDCETNPFCLPGLERVYGIDLSANYTALESGAIVDALDGGAIDIALLFSTDSRIVTNGYVLLEDDEHLLAADNVLPVGTTEVIEAEGVADLLNAISAALTTENLTELNERFDVDVEDPEDIAAAFLEENGLS